MNNLMTLQENENSTIYILQEKLQGLVSVPKDLKNNIKVFLLFKDSAEKENDTDKVVNEVLEVSKQINLGEDNGICIVAFMSNNLSDNNAITYATELNNIKDFVNKIYNSLLRTGNLSKENFVKKLELLYQEDKYKNFVDFLCLQDSGKFHSNSYSELMNKEVKNSSVIQNEDSSSLNNSTFVPNKQDNETINNGSMVAPTSVQPVTETLSIGSVPNSFYHPEDSSGGGPSNVISNNKVLVKTKPNAFINLPAVILILVMSLVVGVSVSLYFLK